MKEKHQDKQAKHRADESADTPPLTLGQSIRRAREAKGLSLRALSRLINMNHAYLARLEAGDYQRPSPEILERLAEALGIEYEDLFALTGQHAPTSLPSFVPYMRARYDVDDETLRKLHAHFEQLAKEHKVKDRPNRFALQPAQKRERTDSAPLTLTKAVGEGQGDG